MDANNTSHHAHSVKFESNPFKVCFNGLDSLFKHNQTLAIVILIVSILGSVVRYVGNFSDRSSQTSSTISHSPVDIVPILIVLIPIFIFVVFLGVAIGTLFYGFVQHVAWKTSRNESTTFMESLNAVVNKFWTLFVANFIVLGKIVGGFLLFIIPGIRATLRYQMVAFPIFESDIKATAAVKKMKELTKDHLIEMFGIMTVASIIPFIGSVLQMGGEAVMYPQLVALKESGAPKPKVHWLNYIGFIIAAFFLLLAGLILVLLAVTLRAK